MRRGFHLQLVHGLFAFHFVQQRIGYGDLDDIARFTVVDIGYAIDLRSLAHCATEQLAVLFPALDEHVHGFPDTGGNKRRANIVRKVAQPLRAIRLLVVVDLVGQIVCAGSLFARVRENADVIEKTLFDEIAKLVEIFFRFPGKARDKRCAQRYLGEMRRMRSTSDSYSSREPLRCMAFRMLG